MNETDALRAHAANLERLTALWRGAIDAVPWPLAVIRADYVIDRANVRFAESAGRSVRAIVGQRCYTTLFGRTEACTGCPLTEVLASGGEAVATLDLPNRSVRVTAHAYPDRRAALCLYADETERRRAEEIASAQERLSLLGQLAAGVAHEMNAPLATILISAQEMQTESRPDQDREKLDQIAKSAHQAQRIVEGLLRIARTEHAEPVARIDLTQVVRDALAAAGPLLAERMLERTFAAELPTVQARATEVTEAVLYLVAGAANAAGTGGRVCVETSREGADLLVTVDDEGLARRDTAGEMLGISLSRDLTQRLGGRLERTKSRFPQGAALRMRLPAN